MKKTIKTDDRDIYFDETPELKEAVYQAVLAFYIQQDCFSGESIMQNDHPQIEAPILVADIADNIFKFDVEFSN